MATMSSLVDPFNATALNTSLWAQFTGGSATISYTSSGATINYPASTTSATDGDISTTSNFDLTGSRVQLQILSVPSAGGATTTDAQMRVGSTTNSMTILWEAGSLYAQQMVAGTNTNLTSVTYSATTHKWWQIRESSGTSFWETSPTGLADSWSTLFSKANPITVTSLQVLMAGTAYSTASSPGAFQFNNLNYIPGTTTSSPVAGTVSPCDAPVNTVVVDLAFTSIQSSAGNQGGLETSTLERFGALYASSTTNQYSELHRAIFNFDTSTIGSGSTITAATLYLCGTFKSNGLGSADLHICGAAPASKTAVVAADFSTVGSTSFGSVTYANYNTTGYNAFAFNSSGMSAINKSGVSSFASRVSWDMLNSLTGTWASGANSRFEGYFADNGTFKPFLSVTWTAGTVTKTGFFRLF